MASNSGGGRHHTGSKFIPEGSGGWSRQRQQTEGSLYYSSLNGYQKQVLAQLTDMFGQSLDREIIQTIAGNCDWNVGNAIESLIELSQENGYAAKPLNRRRNSDQRVQNKHPSPVVGSSPSSIKIAYQGYDNVDDADVIIEEEEEFEIEAKKGIPDKQNAILQPKKVDKGSVSQVYQSVQAAISNGDRIIVVMRGMPGSGKSFMARQLVANVGQGDSLVFSADDFFYRNGRFQFVPEALPDAHEWNRQRVQAVMKQGLSPVIVDNTNTQAWEMKPYLALAVAHGYGIELVESNTPWCWREAELAQRNVHGVPRQTIRKMIDRYEKWTVGSLLAHFKMRYNPNCIPPQRCWNPPALKTANLKPSNGNSKSAKDHQPKKLALPDTSNPQQQAVNVDLLSDVHPLPQRVKKKCGVPVLNVEPVVEPITLEEVASESFTEVNKDSYELPPTPPEWKPLSWDTISDLPSIDNSLPDVVQPSDNSVEALNTTLPTQPTDSVQKDQGELNSIDVPNPKRDQAIDGELLTPSSKSEESITDVKERTTNEEDDVAVALLVDVVLPSEVKENNGDEVNESKDVVDVTELVEAIALDDKVEGSDAERARIDHQDNNIVVPVAKEVNYCSTSMSTDSAKETGIVGDGVQEKTTDCSEDIIENKISNEIEVKQESSHISLVPLSVIETEQFKSDTNLIKTLLFNNNPLINSTDDAKAEPGQLSCNTTLEGAGLEAEEAEEKSPSKLNLFSWLFQKKVKPATNSKPDMTNSYQKPWQPYEPRDVSDVGDVGVKIPEVQTDDISADLKSEHVEGTEDDKEVQVEEPMSLMLDADDLLPELNNLNVEMSQSQVNSSTDVLLVDNEVANNSEEAQECDDVALEVTVESSGDDIPELSIGNMDSWAKLDPEIVIADEISNCTLSSPMKHIKNDARPKTDAETNTSHADFALLGQEDLEKLNVIFGNSRSINAGATSLPVRPPPHVFMLDKGSMTKPLEEEPSDYDLELLVKMFPKIPKDDLIEVFERCQKEINWTVELLLESGYAFELAPDVELRFEVNDQLQELLETQELLEELNSRDSSLIKSQTAESSTVPEDASATGKVVSDTQVAGSHFGLFGSNESLENAEITEGKESVKTSPTKKGPKKQSQLTLQLKKQMEESFVLNSNCYSEETLRIKRIRHGESSVAKSSGIELPHAGEPTIPSAAAMNDTLDIPHTSACDRLLLKSDEISDEEEDSTTVPLTLDADFLGHLRQMFGEPLLPYADGVAVVDLPVSLARQIHGYLAESQVKQLEMQEQYFQNMIKDEEFARRLQEEEMPAPGLQQIMDMELALELYRADSAPRQTKEDLATKLSKQKLAELFPTVDRTMLFDVFEAHGRSFADTFEVLEASVGEVEMAARNVMSPQVMADYEKQLLQKAKEENSKQLQAEIQGTCEPDTPAFASPKDQAKNDAKKYRDEANRLYKLRNECYQKANNAQRSGMPSVASYYAQVGHLYKQRIESANSHAASSLLSAQAINSRSTTLDLHFLYVAEALEALDIFLDHHIARISETGAVKSEALFIITGSGQHSVGGRPKIRPAVQRRLLQRKLRYQEVNSGMLSVTITKNAQLCAK